MFIIGDPDKADTEEVLALRPMTCPFQFQAYLTKTRSYRDLPIRYNETSTLFRNESSGEMHGLIRVRQFTISEGHLVCTPEQLEQEFRGCLDLAQFMLKAVGFDDDVSYRFSQVGSERPARNSSAQPSNGTTSRTPCRPDPRPHRAEVSDRHR